MKLVKVFFTLIIITLMIGCDNQTSFHNPILTSPKGVDNVLFDTLHQYLSDYFWTVTDDHNNVTCSPIVYICFQQINKKNYVSFAMSPNVIIDTSNADILYCRGEKPEIICCFISEKIDSTILKFVDFCSFEPLDSSDELYYGHSCCYDGRIFLKSFEIINSTEKASLSAIKPPLSKWVCNPPKEMY